MQEHYKCRSTDIPSSGIGAQSNSERYWNFLLHHYEANENIEPLRHHGNSKDFRGQLYGGGSSSSIACNQSNTLCCSGNLHCLVKTMIEEKKISKAFNAHICT